MSFNLPFLVWMLIGFFEGIPRELEEAAALDGLSPLKTFFKIIVPVATPGILAAAILSFIFCWNEFLFALILSGGETMTIPVRLAAMKTKQGILIAKLSAGVILAIFPMVIISPFVKKYLISGLTLGSVK
jgi:multiple sugar transport system permease protein